MKNFHKNQPNSEEYYTFFSSKILNFYLTDINIYLVNNKTNNILENYIFDSKKSKQKKYFLDIRSDPE